MLSYYFLDHTRTMYTSILPAYFTLFQEESFISKTSATL